MNRCGKCRHAKPTPDLNVRICMFHPPQMIAIPRPGGVQMQGMRPPVAVNEEACGAGFSPGIYGVEEAARLPIFDLPVTQEEPT